MKPIYLQTLVAVLAAAFVGMGLALGAPPMPVVVGVLAWTVAAVLAKASGRRTWWRVAAASLVAFTLLYVGVRGWAAAHRGEPSAVLSS